jgi:hypothetical protein
MEKTMSPSDEIAALFIGSWSLVSFTLTTVDGRAEYPFGADAVGCIMYTGDGYMAAHLMRRQRTLFASEKRQASTLDERAAAYLDYFSYCGSYTVKPGALTVTHHVLACSSPNWVGRDQVRTYRFSGDSLTLWATIADGSQNTIVWQRH